MCAGGAFQRPLRRVRDVGHGMGHFLGRCRYLRRLGLLAARAVQVRIGHCVHLVGRQTELTYCIADPADGFVDLVGKFIERPTDVADLVRAVDVEARGQVAITAGNLTHAAGDTAQWRSDRANARKVGGEGHDQTDQDQAADQPDRRAARIRRRRQLLGDDAAGYVFDLSCVFHQGIGHLAVALACSTQVDVSLQRNLELRLICRSKLVERSIEGL